MTVKHSSELSLDVALGDVTGYVNAGGRGTRLSSIFTPDKKIGVSKALLKVGEPPLVLIEHQINKLLAAGVRNVVVGAGDHEVVARHVEAVYGTTDRVRAVYSREHFNTGGDLLRALRKSPGLFCKDVVIANVDTILDWSEVAVVGRHRESRADLTVNLTLSKGVPNEGAFFVGDGNQVLYHRDSTVNTITEDEAKKCLAYRGSSTGALVVSVEFLAAIEWQPSDGPSSLFTDVVAASLVRGGLYAYDNQERFFIDVGTVATWNWIQNHPETVESYLCRQNLQGG